MLPGDPDEQRMSLVVDAHTLGQGILQQAPHLLVWLVAPDQPMSGEDSPGVGIDDEHPPAGGIKKDRVGRFRADPADGEQPRTQRPQRQAKITFQIPARGVSHVREERPQGAGLLSIKSGRTDQAGDPCSRRRFHAARFE